MLHLCTSPANDVLLSWVACRELTLIHAIDKLWLNVILSNKPSSISNQYETFAGFNACAQTVSRLLLQSLKFVTVAKDKPIHPVVAHWHVVRA